MSEVCRGNSSSSPPFFAAVDYPSSDAAPQRADPSVLPNAGRPTRSPRAGEVRPIIRAMGSPGGKTTISFGDDSVTQPAMESRASRLGADSPHTRAGSSGAMPSGASGELRPVSAKPLTRYMPRKETVTLGSDNVVYSCGTKEAHMRLALDPALAAEYAGAPMAGTRVAPVDRTATKAMNVGGEDRFLAATATHPGEGPGSYAISLQEAQRRAVFDASAREAAAALPVAGVNVRTSERGLKVTRPAGGPQQVKLEWPESGGGEPGSARKARLRGNNDVSGLNDSFASSVSVSTPRSASHNRRGGESVAELVSQTSSSSSADVSAGGGEVATGARRRLLYPEQPVGGRSATFLKDAGSGASASSGSAASGSAASSAGSSSAPLERGLLTPSRTHTSRALTTGPGGQQPYHTHYDVSASHQQQPSTPGRGGGSAGSFDAPITPSQRLRVPQPVGGRGLMLAGLSGLDAPDARIGGGIAPSASASGRRNTSSITFG